MGRFHPPLSWFPAPPSSPAPSEAGTFQDRSACPGYTVSLHGWTHTRDYAGFLRNQDGHATAQVTGLSPNEVYLYEASAGLTGDGP